MLTSLSAEGASVTARRPASGSIGSSDRGVERGEAIIMSGRSYERCCEEVVGSPSSFPNASRKARR